MGRKAYKFNPQTLTYEPVMEPMRIRAYRLVRKMLVGFIVVCIFNLLFSTFFYTPKMHRIQQNKQELLVKYSILNDKIRIFTQKLDELKQRDNHVYRSLFAADTLDVEGIYTPYAESTYAYLKSDSHAGLMIDSWKHLDAAARRLYLQSLSFDQLQPLAKDKEKMSSAIPAIWPVDRRNLRGSIGAYGRRLHPIYHRYLQHKGIDLGGNTGDPVYATANAVVKSVDNGLRRRGYGRQILLDHGFGYQTRYAHLSEIDVVPGQQVRRGELIGKVGSTGGSTGPHLHYEVIYMGHNVDPINYFRRDMSEEEFERIIESAKATTFETDL